jgi:hypothetical protein
VRRRGFTTTRRHSGCCNVASSTGTSAEIRRPQTYSRPASKNCPPNSATRNGCWFTGDISTPPELYDCCGGQGRAVNLTGLGIWTAMDRLGDRYRAIRASTTVRLIAALGPRMLHLAATSADGAHT